MAAFLMALMINPRHLFYGISMLDKYRGTGLKKIYLIFGMCDESFSINYTAKVPEGVDKGWFMFFVTLLNHLYWVSGATLGGLFQGTGHTVSHGTHGVDALIGGDFTADSSQGHFGTGKGYGNTGYVAFDAGDFHQAGHRVADQA